MITANNLIFLGITLGLLGLVFYWRIWTNGRKLNIYFFFTRTFSYITLSYI